MAETMKAGSAGTLADLRKSVLANNSDNNLNPTDLQARRILRRFAFSLPMAVLVASLAYGERR